MPYLVIKSASNATPESYQLTNTWEKPRLAVKTQKTSTSSYSYTVTTTALTSGSNSEGMSSVSSYTDVSTTNTVYETGTSSISSYKQTFLYTDRDSFQNGSTSEQLVSLTSEGAYQSIVSSNTYLMETVTVSMLRVALTSSMFSNEVKRSPDYIVTTDSRSAPVYPPGSVKVLITIPTLSSEYTTHMTVVRQVTEDYSKTQYRTANISMTTYNTLNTNTVYETASGTYYSGVSSSTLSESASTTCYTDISSLYLPLSTDTSGAGLKVKDSGNTYRVMRTTTVSHSQSASATFLTSAVDSAGLFNTTALTRSSTSATLTRSSSYGTQVSTKLDTNTIYTKSKSSVSYRTYYGQSTVTSKSLSVYVITATRSIVQNNTDTRVYGTYRYSSYSSLTYSSADGYTGFTSRSQFVNQYTIDPNYGGEEVNNGYNGYTVVSKVNTLTIGTITITRSSISGYGTRESISGYSGISSSSSSESASTTSWG